MTISYHSKIKSRILDLPYGIGINLILPIMRFIRSHNLKMIYNHHNLKKQQKFKLINHSLIICFVIITYEFVKYVNLNNILKSNLVVYKKILRLFKYSKASDFRKEKLILSYSKLLFIS